MTKRHCFQCETENPHEQAFCGNCGSALTLKDYISAQVAKELTNAVRDRDILETESSIKVFEQAWKWMSRAVGIFVAAGALILAWAGWKASDFRKSVDSAKDTVVQTENSTLTEIHDTSAQSIGAVQKASKSAIDYNHTSSDNAIELSKEMKVTASQTKAELKNEASSVRTEVANSKTELEAVKKLQPEFDAMRAQLGKATSDLAAQQKVISSSEDFVKQIFSTHITYTFPLKEFVQPNLVVIPAPQGVKNSVVYMLVPNTPIDGTMQLQWGVFAQPPGSYVHIHNLIIFFWGDPAENLKLNSLALSFFPDKSDKDTIKALTLRDGRVYADDQPMLKFGQSDPDFKGNKWMPPRPPA
jgi:hypothetical protein